MFAVALTTLSCYSASVVFPEDGVGVESGGLGFCPHPACERGLLYNTSSPVLVSSWGWQPHPHSSTILLWKRGVQVEHVYHGEEIYFIKIDTQTEPWRERKFFIHPQ